MMVRKRLKKLEGISKEIGPPKKYGPKEAETILVCWGSTYGALKEAVDKLNESEEAVRMIHLSEVWPFPAEAFRESLEGSKRFIVVESNANGQMSHLIRAETGLEAAGRILRYDGRPISPRYILNKYWEKAEY